MEESIIDTLQSRELNMNSALVVFFAMIVLYFRRKFYVVGPSPYISPATAFRPHVGTPLPMFVYIHLHGLKCVDRRRQGDTGTAVPTFTYVHLHLPTSHRHTSPKFVHGCRHTLLPPNFKLTSILAFKIFSFPFPPFTSSYAPIFMPTDHA